MHFLKRQGFYIPRGALPEPAAGMACFLDYDDRGRFNFAPDRSGIILKVKEGQIESIALSRAHKTESGTLYIVDMIEVLPKSPLDLAIIGYSDLP